MGASTSACCSEKSSVYNLKKGSWASPFQTAGEYLNVSDLWARSASAGPKGDMPTVVLVGGTGVGKSNLGNYLLGRCAFESRNSQESVTTCTSWMDGAWFGGRHPVRVVDCTGIGDTKGAGADQRQWDTTIDVLKRVGKINTLVMVMRAGRFTKFDREVIATLRESFGPHFWKNMCVFCTGASAKPQQLSIEAEGPKIRRKLTQIEKEHGCEETALQAIQRMHVYAADLDPVLVSPESRSLEFKFKPALASLSLEDLLALDLRIPANVMEMSGEEFRRFASADPAVERWIEGNYFQLGLARLAAFKGDVASMDPFHPGRLSRLADAPADDGQEGAGAGGTFDDHLRYFTEPESLEMALLSEDTALVRGSFLAQCAATSTPLPRRQDMPEGALWDGAQLIQALQKGAQDDTDGQPAPVVVAISYCWLSAEHPDPAALSVRQWAPLLEALAGWHRVPMDSLAVFVDWCSLPQEPRSAEDAAAWGRALQHVHLWFAHASASAWLMTAAPDGAGFPAGASPYGARGWPCFERAVSGMIQRPEFVLDLGLLRRHWTGGWGEVLQDCRAHMTPPAAPDAFAAELARKAVAVEADRELLARRYGEAFRGAVGCAERLPYAGLQWGDREAVRVAKLLPLCEACRELELQQNEIGGRGAKALAACLAECPTLERLSLWGNRIDSDAADAVALAWGEAGRPPAGLEIGDQRPPLHPVEAIATDGGTSSGGGLGRGTPGSRGSGFSSRRGGPSSPALNRRSADELAALQMAELGARQAAFEARLHVAINRISSTLCEVGDAVGGGGYGAAPPPGPLPAGGAAGSPGAQFVQGGWAG